jgi:hypothetical protein
VKVNLSFPHADILPNLVELLGSSRGLFRKFYVPFCEAAFQHISNICLPCSYVGRGKACVNVRLNHSKGHQDLQGKIIAAGDFQVNSNEEIVACQTWIDELENELCSIENKLSTELELQRSRSNDSEQVRTLEFRNALLRHKAFLERFYSDFSFATDNFSLSTCFCCLLEVPQHPLPCGHLLCAACVKDFGKHIDGTTTLIEQCPLYPAQAWDVSNPLVHHKPDFAGTRILTLDGYV